MADDRKDVTILIKAVDAASGPLRQVGAAARQFAKDTNIAPKLAASSAAFGRMQQSLAERLSDMARSGMSDLGAWNDLKKQAGEYMAAAKKAAAKKPAKKATKKK